MRSWRKSLMVVFASLQIVGALAFMAMAQEGRTGSGVDLVVTFGQGSAADVIARILAQAAEKHLGEPIRVIQKTMDGGAEGYRYVKGAGPDGRMVIWNSTAVLTMIHQGKLDFDHRAFSGVARITVDPLSLVAATNSSWKDLRSFIEQAKANPGLKIGHEGPGTFAHLVTVSLENAAKVSFTHVQSSPTPNAIEALIQGKIDASSQAVAGIAGAAREGKIRILGVSGEVRSPAFPDVPTFKEQGIPLAMDIWRGLAVPRGTPGEAIARLDAAFEKASKDPSFVEASKKYGFAIRYLGSADFDSLIDKDDVTISAVLEKIGLKKR